MQDKESLAKIRSEFQKVLSEEIKADPALATADRNQQLKRAVSVDSCFDFEYLNMCIMEGLRFQPHGGISPIYFEEEVKLGNKHRITVIKGRQLACIPLGLAQEPGRMVEAA